MENLEQELKNCMRIEKRCLLRLEELKKRLRNEDIKGICVLVHGTFASTELDYWEPADKGKSKSPDTPSWWHANGILAQRLMNKGIYVIPFQWSGDNLESSRKEAAKHLEELLLKVDEIEKPHFTIAHSHGGNIVWETLCEISSSKGKKLKFFERWVTVGTPFFRKRKSLAKAVKASFDVGGVIFTSLLIIAMFIALAVSGDYPDFFKLEGNEDADPGMKILAVTGLIALVPVFVTVIVLLISVPLGVASFLFFVRGRKKRESLALQMFNTKHIAVWSEHDEAINVLRGALHLSGGFVPGFGNWNRIRKVREAFREDEINDLGDLIGFVICVCLAICLDIAFYLANLLIIPWVDRLVAGRIKSKTLGSDVEDAFLKTISVSSHPIEHRPNTCLEKTQNDDMIQSIRNKEATLPLSIRSLICEFSVQGRPRFQKSM